MKNIWKMDISVTILDHDKREFHADHLVFTNVFFQDGDTFCKAFAEAQVHISFLMMVLILLYEYEF